MKIVVCMKQVPDTTEVKIDPVTNTLIRDGVPAIINPDDKCGIEAALQIKEQIPGTTVTVITMGIPAAEIALREALAMGCDDAVLLTDRKLGGADTWATSSAMPAPSKSWAPTWSSAAARPSTATPPRWACRSPSTSASPSPPMWRSWWM